MEGWFKLLPSAQAQTQNTPVTYSKRTDGKIDMESGSSHLIKPLNLIVL